LGTGLSPTCSWPSCLSGIYLLIVHAEISFPSSLVHFQLSCPLCCCTRLQFTVYCSVVFFGGWGGQSSQGLCWFILGVAGRIQCDKWCSPVGSVECLTVRFGGIGGSCGGSSSPQVFSM
jgi:hypothetical protein